MPEAPPVGAAGWFELLHEDAVVGLALLGVTDLVNYALVGLIFLALYGALRKVDKSAMVVATTFAFVGIAVYFASNQALSMLSLSDLYAAATTAAQRAVFLSAGEALLGISQGTGIYLSLFLVLASGLLISIVMLRSTVFNKVTAWAGVLANMLALGYYAALIFAPAYAWLPPSISAPFRLIWYTLIGVQLLRLASRAKAVGSCH